MHRNILWSIVASCMLCCATLAHAETRRDGGGGEQASRKAQYMIRQLHNEKQQLQAQLAEVQGKYDQLLREHEKTQASLDRSSTNNEQLLARVSDNVAKYRELAEKYREAVSILRKANLDNQYMVRAVQEREQWISNCNSRNDELFEVNNNLLNKYGEVSSAKAEPIFGLGRVEVENEVQEYRFKLEDLQVTKFTPTVDTTAHTRNLKNDPDADDKEEGQGSIN